MFNRMLQYNMIWKKNVSFYIIVFLVMTPCSLIGGADIYDEHIASNFRVDRSHSAWESGDYVEAEGEVGETVVGNMSGQSKPGMAKRRNVLPSSPGYK
jgi:hypothetical protein